MATRRSFFTPKNFAKFAVGWTGIAFALPIITMTNTDEEYAKRRDAAKLLPFATNVKSNEDPVKASLDMWIEKDLINENDRLALETAIKSYTLQTKPAGDEMWNGYAQDGKIECPMFIFSGRERCGTAWRGVQKYLLDIEIDKLKSVSKDAATDSLFVEIDSNMRFKALNIPFKFKSSILLKTDPTWRENKEQRGIKALQHRWFGGKLPSRASYCPYCGDYQQLLGVLDAIRFINATMISTLPM